MLLCFSGKEQPAKGPLSWGLWSVAGDGPGQRGRHLLFLLSRSCHHIPAEMFLLVVSKPLAMTLVSSAPLWGSSGWVRGVGRMLRVGLPAWEGAASKGAKDPALLLGFVTQDSLQPRLQRRSCPFLSLRWVFPHQLSHACAGTKNAKLKDLHQLEGWFFFWVGFSFQLPSGTGARASIEEEEEEEGDRAACREQHGRHSPFCTAPTAKLLLQTDTRRKNIWL